MSASDEKNDNQVSSEELLTTDGLHRRNILKFFAGAFAAAALPEVVAACNDLSTSGGAAGEAIETGNLVSFTSIPMTWVTRKQDGLSLGFQFVNIVADANHNIALASGAAPGSGYVAITFPPQHIMEDAVNAGSYFSYLNPTQAYASGTSRIVFNVPSTYGIATDAGGIGTFPYTLQGMLELCGLSPTVVPANAMTNAGTSHVVGLVPLDEHEKKFESLAQAKIDRTIARVDPRAAARVRRRVARSARMLNPDLVLRPIAPIINPIHIVHNGTAPVAPASGETSIELPLRLLMSPNETVGWSFMASPVASPSTLATDAARTEVWHARPGLPNPVTGLADPSLGGLTLRALWTRDWDASVHGNPLPASTDGGAGQYGSDPVLNANPDALNRAAIVANTGDMSGSALPALNVNRLLLSPIGGTIDLSAQFTPTSTSSLSTWVQKTVLGRDEYVECINVGTILPFGHAAALVTINKRADDPTQGTVGVFYSQAYLVVSQPLVSYHDLPNASDYNTFPFVAVELTQTKIPCATGSTAHGIPAGGSGFVYDPTGATLISVGVMGTDFKGRSIQFSTPIYFCPTTETASAAQAAWVAGPPTGPIGVYSMQRQRIALAPTPDASTTSSTSYSNDSTSFETVSFNIGVNLPSTGSAAAQNLVPVASNITLAVEALRHLQTSPSGGTPNVDSTFNYDSVNYATNGFSTASNPHEIFLTQVSGKTQPLDFTPTSSTSSASNSGGLVAPALNANALSRSAGVMSGSTAAGSALMTGAFNPTDYFGAFLGNIKLFGFVPLGGIIQSVAKDVNNLASQYMPKSVTKELSNAEAFLEKALGLYNLLSSLVGSDGAQQATQILTQVTNDMSSYGQIAQGLVPSGGVALGGLSVNPGAPLTNAQMQAAAWLQSAATQAQELIQEYITTLTNIFTAAEAVFNDITSLEFGSLINADGKSGDLQVFIADLLQLIGEIKSLTSGTTNPQTAAGAVMSYFGPVATAIESAVSDVNGFLTGAANVLTQLMSDLAAISQGLDLAKNLSVEFVWTPLISGIECWEALAFIPSTSHGLKLDIKVNANSNNGPTGLDLTCRLDSFAICFGQGIPTPNGGTTLGCGTIDAGFTTVLQNADVSLVFDHIQVQMLAGQKPDVDCVFNNLYFGGDLAFIETIKNLIPLDSFSDPPFVNVTTSGIVAGFTLGIPNIAIGMFSIQNINIAASLTIPWISTNGTNGVTFEFDFCTIDNPFVVTVCMLGGGGFFGMTLDMQGLQRIQFGVEVCAQLAIDLVVASGSVSIEVGIFLVYTVPSSLPAVADGGTEPIDPVSGEAEVPGWLIGGYLRLRGEVDVAGIITISIEIYLQITYSPTTGKCVASGFIAVDVSLFFFSLHAQVAFSRTFAGSNGDPTFAQMMVAGGVDPMIDPTLLSTSATAAWDPFAEYCMAYT